MATPPKSRLGRNARGLPRYYMDVGWWRHPNFVGLPPEALFVFSAIIGYSTEHATDGVVPANHEDLAAALGIRATVARKAVGPLLDRGCLQEKESSLVVPNWDEHNPTAEDIDAHAATRSQAAVAGNHRRWHVDRGVFVPDECDLCLRDGPPLQTGSPK